MAEEQGASYSDEEYGSASEEAYEKDKYVQDERASGLEEGLHAAPRVEAQAHESGAGVSVSAVVDVADSRDDAEDYEGEDEFEAEDQRGPYDFTRMQPISSGTDAVTDPVGVVMPVHDEPGDADSSNLPTEMRTEPGEQEGEPDNTLFLSDRRKPLVSSRSFSVPAVASIPLASAVDASQRSASVPSVPAAALGRWADGYEHVSDGESSPRSKHALIPLPVLEETRSASLNEEGEDVDSGSDSEGSGESIQSGDDTQSQAIARLRSLSLQHRQQQPVAIPARKAKSHIYPTRLPSVSELAVEDVAQMGVPVDLAKYANTSSCRIADITDEANAPTRLEGDQASPGLHETAAGGDEAPESSSVREFSVETDAPGSQTHDVVLPSSTTDAPESSSGNPPRRETEQLLWEVHTLINAQREDQARAVNIASDKTQDSLLATVGEDDPQEARKRGDSPAGYGDEAFSDDDEPGEDEDVDQYAADDDAFSDDSYDTGGKDGEATGSRDAVSAPGSENNAQMFSIAEFEEDNRRETEALLREAQALIQAQREDLGSAEDVAAYDNTHHPRTVDPHGEEDDFDEDEVSDRNDGDPYLTDDSDDPVKNGTEECLAPDARDSSSTEKPTNADDSTSRASGGGLTGSIHPSEEQGHAQDKSDEGAANHPNTDTLRNLRNYDTASMLPDPHGETETVAAGEQEANHNSDIAQEESTSVTDPSIVSSPPKRPHPPPVKPNVTPKAGRRVTSNASVTSHPTPPLQGSNNSGRATRISRKSPSIRRSTGAETQDGIHASRKSATTDVSVSKKTSDSDLTSPSAIISDGQAPSPARSTRCSPPKYTQTMPLPDEYPPLPRKDPVPRQKKTAKKLLSPELLRELKPVKSPPNLRIDAQIVDKDKRDWLFLNMFRHGDDVSKYEPFIPRSVLSQPSKSDSIVRPPSASNATSSLSRVERGKPSTPYDFGGRKLLKPQDPTLLEREKNWVATKPHDSAIPSYDSILDKYCATITSPVIQRHIYHTRYQDLSPQLAFVLEKRVEQHFKQVVRAAKSPASTYRADPTGQ